MFFPFFFFLYISIYIFIYIFFFFFFFWFSVFLFLSTLLLFWFLLCVLVGFIFNWLISFLVCFVHWVTPLYFAFFGMFWFHSSLCVCVWPFVLFLFVCFCFSHLSGFYFIFFNFFFFLNPLQIHDKWLGASWFPQSEAHPEPLGVLQVQAGWFSAFPISDAGATSFIPCWLPKFCCCSLPSFLSLWVYTLRSKIMKEKFRKPFTLI